MRFIYLLFSFALRAGHSLRLSAHSALVICTFCAVIFTTSCGKDGNSGGSSSSPPPPSVNHAPQITELYWAIVRQDSGDWLDWGSIDITRDSPPTYFNTLLLIWDVLLGVEYTDEDGDACDIYCRIMPSNELTDKGQIQASGPEPYQVAYRPPAAVPYNGCSVTLEFTVQDSSGGFDIHWVTLSLYGL